MSLAPNPDAPIEEADPTEVIEPMTPDAVAGDDTGTTMTDPGPADPRSEIEPGAEFDPTIAPHFL